MTSKFFVQLFSVFLFLIFGTEAVTNSRTDQLRLTLLEECGLTPLATTPNEMNPMEPVESSVMLSIDKFIDINDLQQTIDVRAMFQVSLSIDCIVEKIQHYNETKEFGEIPLGQWFMMSGVENFWQLPVSHQNSASDFAMNDKIKNVLLIDPVNGTISYQWVGHFLSECALQLPQFPFDSQKCSIVFNIWQSKMMINVTNVSLQWTFPDKKQSNQSAWEVIDANPSAQVVYNQIDNINGYFETTFWLNFNRRPNYFIYNIITPILILSVVQIATFQLPFGSLDRASFAITILLAFSVAQGSISQNVPKTSENLLLVWALNCNVFSSLFVTFYTTITSGVFASDRFKACLERQKCGLSLARIIDILTCIFVALFLVVTNVTICFCMLA